MASHFFVIAIAFLWILFVVLSLLRRRNQDMAGGVPTKVIYSDGTLGQVDSSVIEELRTEGKIAAYQDFHTWIEVRRNLSSDQSYQGPERRKSHFTIR